MDQKELELRLRLLDLDKEKEALAASVTPPESQSLLQNIGTGIANLGKGAKAAWDIATTPMEGTENLPGVLRVPIQNMTAPARILMHGVSNPEQAAERVRDVGLGMLPGGQTGGEALTDALTVGANYALGQPSQLKPMEYYRDRLEQEMAAYGASAGLGGVISKVMPKPSGLPLAAKVTQEAREIAQNPELLGLATKNPDVLSSELASSAQAQQQALSKARGAAFENLPEGQVDILEPVSAFEKDIRANTGVLNPQSPTSAVLENATALATGPEAPTIKQFQNLHRDVGAAWGKNKSSWEGASLKKLYEDLEATAKSQLSPEKFNALKAAWDGWKDYAEVTRTGSVDKVLDITYNDRRLSTFYNALIQDAPSASQLINFLGPEQQLQAQALTLQKLLSKNAPTWGQYISDHLPQYQAIFSDDIAHELSSWASGQSGGAVAKLISPPKRFIGSGLSGGVAYGGMNLLGIPGAKYVAPLLAARTYMQGNAIRGARNFLRQAAMGDKQALQLLNDQINKNGMSATMDALVSGAIGNELSGMVEVPEQGPAFSRNWDDIKGDYNLRNMALNLFKELNLLPKEASAEELPDEAGKGLLLQASQIAPDLFQPGAGGYTSQANGRLYDPFEKDMHIQAAIDLPVKDRAQIIGSMWDGGKLKALPSSPTPVNMSPKINPQAISALPLSQQSQESQGLDLSADQDTTSILKELEDKQRLRMAYGEQ